MRKIIFRTNIITGFFCLLTCCLLMTSYGFGEESSTAISKKERARINYVLKIEKQKEIRTFLSQPAEKLSEKILKDIEKDKQIEIKRSSMIKSDKCLHELLAGIAHLAKISSGLTIERVVVKLVGTTSRASIWDPWEVRKLETPELTVTVYYNNPDVAPSEIVCLGHKYH